jgi:hypothetical protein|tara:strand:+ start:29 stop:298 length:270 start_codon:yes stop_codon:yes gene_type:complete
MRLAGNGSIDDASEYPLDEDNKRFAGDDDLDIFLETYELLKSKGYSSSAAGDVAERMTLHQEPMAKKTIRFARIYDDTSTNSEESDISD